MSDLKKLDIIFYTVLLLILSLGAHQFYKYRFDDGSRFIIIILTGAGYLSWSIVYHHVRGDLSLKLFLEYALLFGICLTGAILVQWI